MTVTQQCYRGRSRTSRRPRVSRHAGCTRSIATACKRKPFGAVALILWCPCTCHRRRCSRRKPAAACGTRRDWVRPDPVTGRVHPVCMAPHSRRGGWWPPHRARECNAPLTGHRCAAAARSPNPTNHQKTIRTRGDAPVYVSGKGQMLPT